MSPTPFVLAALASCRILSNSGQIQLSAKQEVFEFHLHWLHLSGRYWDAPTEELSQEINNLAVRVAQFVLRHESRLSLQQPYASYGGAIATDAAD
jgi:hypothetical protein